MPDVVVMVSSKNKEQTDQVSLPQHIVVVMDGNGRWAKKRLLPRTAGHHAGVKSTRKLVEFCVRDRIKALTLFAFSSENWKRPEQEVSSLMELFVNTLQSEVQALHEQQVRIRFIGECSAFSDKLQQKIQSATELTQHNQGLQLNIAVNYGGRWDITQACRSLLEKIERRELSVDDVHAETLDQMVCLNELEDPDLFIRTGGEKRISNFLIWQLAYTELYFSDVLWPDFGEDEYRDALEWFQGRQRRFGQTGEQVDKSQPA